MIIQAFKRKEFIENAIMSVLNQTLDKREYEIIVIKAFRDKKIDALIKRYKIKSVYNPSEKEGIRLISAFAKIRGQMIAFLDDDDDEFEANKLEFVYKYFKENPNLIFYHNLYSTIDENSRIVNNKDYYDLKHYTITDINKKSYVSLIKELHASTNASSMSIKKSILIKNKKRLKDVGVTLDVFLLLIALLENNDMLVDNRMLTRYRIHKVGKVTQGKLKNLNEFCEQRAKSTKDGYNETKILYKIAFNNGWGLLFREIFIETKLYYTLFNTKTKQNNQITTTEIIIFLISKHFSKSSISLVLQAIISRFFKIMVLKLIYKHEVETYENITLQHI